jgi:DNA mismatch endonuclease, patch repair protein
VVTAPPVPSSPGVQGRMQRQRRKDTAPELALRRSLHAVGLRYRVGWPVPGAPRRTIDIAFTRIKLAVFVDGCFWHGCPAHATWPKANSEWWRVKIETNRRRDDETTALLEGAGWTVLRFWEHDGVEEAASRVWASVAALRTVEVDARHAE